MKQFNVGDKVQAWFPTNQRGSDGHPLIDLAAGVVIEVDGNSINNPYLVRFDNLDGTYIDHWLAAPDLDYRDWDTKAEDKAKLHNPKTHTVTSILVWEVDETTTVEIERTGNEQLPYSPNRRIYSDPRCVDRLLNILNSDKYSHEIRRGRVSGCLMVYCKPKE